MSDQLKKFFSEDQINQIGDFIFSELKTKDRIKSGEVYEHFLFVRTALTKVPFCIALSNSIKSDTFPNVEIKRGRYGGIRLKKPGVKSIPVKKTNPSPRRDPLIGMHDHTDSVVVEAGPWTANALPKLEEPEKPKEDERVDRSRVIAQPKENMWASSKKNDLYIDGKRYASSMTNLNFKTIVEKVLEIKPTKESVRIKFGEMQYSCTDEQADMLDRLLFYCFGASIVISSSSEPGKQTYDWEKHMAGKPAEKKEVVEDFDNYVPPLKASGFVTVKATPGKLPDPEWDE